MFHVRPAVTNDSATIVDFQLEMAKETEGLALNNKVLSEGVMAVFNDPQKGRYFVAEKNGKVVASMMITREWSDWRNQWVYWLQSVFIVPELRGQGLFRKMYETIQQLVKEDKDVTGIRLYVDASNKKALEVYKAVGMDGEHYRTFEWMKAADT